MKINGFMPGINDFVDKKIREKNPFDRNIKTRRIYAAGSDTNIDLNILPKGTGQTYTKNGIKLNAIADADADNNSLYLSSDSGVLSWKNSAGTVVDLF